MIANGFFFPYLGYEIVEVLEERQRCQVRVF